MFIAADLFLSFRAHLWAKYDSFAPNGAKAMNYSATGYTHLAAKRLLSGGRNAFGRI
ncbi:MAG: hypothetical protein QOE77_1078 [Blastocatellia bacterium]|jgi:hypothetical protein|nr:hypothetical protein [Blastocatellia bacterium]